MTSFIRSIFQAAPGATLASTPATTPIRTMAMPSTASTTSTSVSATIKTEPANASTTTSSAPTRPDIVKVEIVEPSATAASTAAAMAMALHTGKAQRAARRDAVNARRDKRKAGHNDVTLSPTAFSELRIDTTSDEDKSKKMKTGRTSSFAVAGGLGASTSTTSAVSTTTTTNKRATCASTTTNASGALLFTPEIDPAGEERIRAMEAQLETLDPDSKEAKKKRRLIRNRMSAQLHRERKKAYVGQLEEQLLEKDRELKELQEKLSKMMDESEKLRKQVEGSASATASPAPASTTEAAPLSLDGDLQLKEEAAPSWDSPWPLSNADQWDFTLDDAEMVDFDTDDLLRNIDNPFAALDANAELSKPSTQHGEIHTAKKNIAMMMAVMFSVGFFGNTTSLCDLSTNSAFANLFEANSAKEFSQISIASRIVACLEKTSWKDFRDVSSWLSQRRKTNAEAEDGAETESENESEKEDAEMEDVTTKPVVASPSARSDLTDSCGSPAQMLDETLDSEFPSSLIEDFVDEPFAMGPLSESNWLADSVSEPLLDDTAGLLGDEMSIKTETKNVDSLLYNRVAIDEEQSASSSLTTRMYNKLSTLWKEKNQVLLTVFNDKKEVLQRSVADMSTIREGLQTGDFFTPARSGDGPSTVVGEDHSISFLYPISALGAEKKSFDAGEASADPVFFEVSCQLNSGALPKAKM